MHCACCRWATCLHLPSHICGPSAARAVSTLPCSALVRSNAASFKLHLDPSLSCAAPCSELAPSGSVNMTRRSSSAGFPSAARSIVRPWKAAQSWPGSIAGVACCFSSSSSKRDQIIIYMLMKYSHALHADCRCLQGCC